MKFRNTLVLALIVAALGAYLWFVERPAVEEEAKKKTLLAFDRDKVAAVELVYPDHTIKLARSGDKWTLVAPIEAEADATTVKSLVNAIADAELKKTIDEKPESLAPFGLDKPTAAVSLTLEDGSAVPKLLVGKTTPVGYSAYAKLADQTAVLLTTSAFHSGVRKEVKDLRDKTVLTFEDDAVQELRIARGGEPEIVLKKEAEGWSLAKPVAAKADPQQVRSYLSTLRAMRALGFVDETQNPPDQKYGLTPPRMAVTLLVGADRAEKKLLVGGSSEDVAKKEVYVERGEGGPIFTVGDYLLSSLGKKPVDFRDKTVLSFDKDQLGSVVVSDAAGGAFTLEKKDGKWTIADAGDSKPKEHVIERFIDDVRTLKGTDVVSESAQPAEFGLDQPAVKIELRTADGSPIGTVRAAQRGTGEEKKIFAGAEGSKTVYTLGDYVFQRVDKRRADFLEVPPPSPAPATSPHPAG